MAFPAKFVLVVLLGSPVVSAKIILELGARLVAAAGLLVLVKFWMGVTLGFPFSTIGDAVLDLYDVAVEWCLSWAEPFLQQLVQHWFPALALSENWRQVTTLTALYMSRSVVTAATADIRFRDRHGREVAWNGDKLCAVWRALCGALLALAAGVGVGLMPPFGATQGDWRDSVGSFANGYVFVLIPVAAITLYHVFSGVFQALFRKYLELDRRPTIKTRLGILLGFSKAALRRAADVLILPRRAYSLAFYAPFVLLVSVAARLPNPGFAALFAFVLYLGQYFSREGKEQALRQSPEWHDVYFSQGSAKIGTSILGAITWAFIGIGIDWLLGR